MTKTKKIWIGAGTLAGAAVLTIGGVTTAFAGGTPGNGDHDKPLTGTTLTQASDAAIEAAGGGEVTESETSDDAGSAYEVTVRTADGAEVDVELDKSFGVVKKEIDTDTDTDTPLTGATLTQASDAAIKAAGGGEVSEAETSDVVGSAYEVDVLTADGQEVEVQLDKSFNVVSQQAEAAETGNDADQSSDTGTPAPN